MNLDYNQIELIDKIQLQEDKILAAAEFYTKSGFYIIPIRPNEKAIPPKRDGISYNSATNNPKTARTWFSGKYKGWNIGLCCGAEDGIFVLDVDSHGEKNGFDALEQMVEDHGEFQTAAQITPTGGEHYVFCWFENGRSSTSKIARGIDTRGGDGNNGSHIVAWPSTINGRQYQWKRTGRVSEAPPWLEDLLGTPWDTQSRGSGRGNENVDDQSLETHFSAREIWSMLKCINPDGLEYEEWLQIGQAIHSQHPDDTGLKLWDAWSRKGDRYEEGECDKRWSGFKAYGPIRIGTLIHYAKAGGYVIKPNVTELDFSGEKSDYEQLIEEMNRDWGIAVVGGKIRIVGTGLNQDPEQDLQLLTLDDFKSLNMNRKVAVETAGGTKAVPVAQIWLSDEKRKEYRGGIHFRPDQPTEFDAANGLTYNMWRGWKVKPKEGSWKLLKAHIREVLCNNNHAHYKWILDWMADMYQDPANPKGCAVVMHGVEGCGKGTFMEAMGRTLGRHYKHLTQESHLTGQFNGHMQDAMLVFADEVTYGGSRKTSGNLKALVTEPKLMVERKGVDAYSFKNCARIGIASNEDWFIPAGPQSRRWFVLEVSDKYAQNDRWFTPIYEEMDNGGIEAMMYELMERKITSNLKTAPVTDALLEQRDRFAESRFDSLQAWMFDVLEARDVGAMCFESDSLEDTGWASIVSKPDLYGVYKAWCNNSGLATQPITKSRFYNEITRYGFIEVRPNTDKVVARMGGVRRRMYQVPDHNEACAIFTKLTGKEL